jgi:hypothetical protein
LRFVFLFPRQCSYTLSCLAFFICSRFLYWCHCWRSTCWFMSRNPSSAC